MKKLSHIVKVLSTLIYLLNLPYFAFIYVHASAPVVFSVSYFTHCFTQHGPNLLSITLLFIFIVPGQNRLWLTLLITWKKKIGYTCIFHYTYMCAILCSHPTMSCSYMISQHKDIYIKKQHYISSFLYLVCLLAPSQVYAMLWVGWSPSIALFYPQVFNESS